MSESHSSDPHPQIADKVLERIAEERVTPRPRWQFTATNVTYWLLWGVCTLIGAAAVAAVVFAVANAGWEFREVTHHDLFAFLLGAMPYLWIAALAVVMFAAFENLRHTQTGYRYPMLLVLGLSVLGSAAIGVALYAAGVGQQVEEEIGGHIPLNHPMLEGQRGMWTSPAHGILAGEVVSVADQPNDADDTFVLRTFDGKQWTISLGQVSPFGRDVLARSPLVRVIGAPVDATSTDQPFHACFVFPWVLRGGTHHPPRLPQPFMNIAVPADGEANCDGIAPEESARLRGIERMFTAP